MVVSGAANFFRACSPVMKWQHRDLVVRLPRIARPIEAEKRDKMNEYTRGRAVDVVPVVHARVQTVAARAMPGTERRAAVRKQPSAELNVGSRAAPAPASGRATGDASQTRHRDSADSRPRSNSPPSSPSPRCLLDPHIYILLLCPSPLRPPPRASAPDVHAVGTHPPRPPPHSSSIGTLPTFPPLCLLAATPTPLSSHVYDLVRQTLKLVPGTQPLFRRPQLPWASTAPVHVESCLGDLLSARPAVPDRRWLQTFV